MIRAVDDNFSLLELSNYGLELVFVIKEATKDVEPPFAQPASTSVWLAGRWARSLYAKHMVKKDN